LALTRQQKETLIEGYAQKVNRAQVMIWANYRSMKVAQIGDLRRQLRPLGGEAVVVKNTIMRHALENAGRPTNKEIMDGPCVVTFVYGEVAPVAKVVTDYARLNEAVFQVTGGVAGNSLLTTAQVQALTTLPSREIMLARVVGGIQAPISSFVGTLAAMVRGVMNVLNARIEQLEGSPS
jgi:large subunit ribosomal protein L10